MKRLSLIVLAILVSFGGLLNAGHVFDDLTFTVVGEAQQAPAEAQQDPAKITVYVTRTGEKYHKDGCRHLRQSRIATTLKEATARKLGACSVCKPPTIQ